MSLSPNRSSKRKRSMFGPPKYKKYEKIVKLTSVEDAKESAKELLHEFKSAETKAKKLRVLRATQLAANRAEVMTKRKKRPLKSSTKREKKKIAAIYERATEKMEKEYERLKK